MDGLTRRRRSLGGVSIKNPVSGSEYPYPNLAELREALRSDDVDRVESAYEILFSNDIQPRDVQSRDPPVQSLVDAGVLPPDEGSDDGLTVAERDRRKVELLERIAEAVEGSNA